MLLPVVLRLFRSVTPYRHDGESPYVRKPHGLHIPATRCGGNQIKDRPDRYRRICQTPHCFSHLKAHSTHLRL